MKISYKWLKELIDFDQSPEVLSDILTALGLEVSDIETIGGVPGNFEGLVVAEVLSAEQHPNADRLRLCQVDMGTGTPVQVVCGAPNVAVGQKVVFGPVGTTLYPKEGDPFTLKKAKIRGVESEGMICAEDEIGLGTSHDGIMVLAADTPVGTPFNQVVHLDSDTILEVELTPNRVDAASHYGVARDLAAYFRSKAKLPANTLEEAKLTLPNPIAIDIEDAERCKRYTGIYIQGVTVKESPEWVQNRLRNLGLRPINNVVDVTNIVLHELGHPLHAFDADQLSGSKVVIRTVPAEEKFTTLDDVSRTLVAGEDLMICDDNRPLCIAGVMGGLNSGVTATTKNIFLESAYFEAWSVRRTAKRMGLSTDSSFRFERGADPEMTVTAALRAAALIIELAGGEASVVTDVQKEIFEPFAVEFSLSKFNRIAGRDFTPQEVTEILQGLEMAVAPDAADGDLLHLKVPRYRVDVKRDVDVMEDLLRVFGYNNIQVPEQMAIPGISKQHKDRSRLRVRISEYLAAAGFQEVLNNSLVPRAFGNEHAVELLNPLSEDLAVMRQSMVPGLLETIRYNQNRQQPDVAIFEWGKTYDKRNERFIEQEWLAMAISGQRHPTHYELKSPKAGLQALVAVAEQLQVWLNLSGNLDEAKHPAMDYALEWKAGKQILFTLGKVSAELSARFDLRNEAFVLLASWPKLAEAYFATEITYNEIPVYPSARRDFSLMLPEGALFEQMRKRILAVDTGLIRKVELHDVYRGKNLPEGRKSYLLSIVLRDDRKTLADDAADKVTSRIAQVLEQEFAAEIRRG